MSRIVLYDPGFAQRYGHHYTYNGLLRDALARTDSGFVFLCSRYLPEDVAAEFPGIRRELASVFYEGGRAGESAMDRLKRRARLFAEDLAAFSREIGESDTVFFAHTLDPSALLGVALWLKALEQESRPAAVLNLMLGAGSEGAYREELGPAVWLLKGMERVSLFGGTPALAGLLSELAGRPCGMLPSPLPETLPAGSPPERITYGIYGDARGGKNFHILPEAITRYFAKGGRGGFSFSCMPTDAGIIDTLAALHELGRNFPGRVHSSFGHLDVREYYAGIAASTALIVPYSYGRFRPSGLVIEAAATGVPLIGLAGGFAEDELTALDNGSLFMHQATPALLARALLRFDEESDARCAKARSAAERYRAVQGTEALLKNFECRM